eukprot:1669598-Pleurochrysis_carterae.AAC.2
MQQGWRSIETVKALNSLLESRTLLGLKDAGDLDVAVRTLRWTVGVDGQTVELGEWSHVRRAVAAEEIPPLSSGAGRSVEPFRLLQLAPKTASVVGNR